MEISDLPELIVLVTVAGAVLLFAIPLFSGLATQGAASAELQQDIVRTDGGSGDLSALVDSGLTVEQSLGDAARLDGTQDSYISGPVEANVSGDAEVTTWVRVNNTPGTQLVYADTERLLLYRGSTNEWVAAYYNATDGQTWTVTELANDPTTWTHVTVAHNDSDLTIYENNTDTSTTTLTDGNAITGNVTADSNLDGSLDETRVFDRVLTSTERQQLIDQPTAPLTGAERSSRIMYDTFADTPSSYPAFITGGSLNTVGVSKIAGFDGATVTESDWSRSVLTLSSFSGPLAGAPGVYASYQSYSGAFAGLTALFTGNLIGSLMVFPTVFVIIALVFIVSVLMTLRD